MAEKTVSLDRRFDQHLQTIPPNNRVCYYERGWSRYVNFMKQWKKLIEKAKVGKVTPHVLRHTWATALVRAGVDLMTVKELGRWSDLKLVTRYSHIDATHRTREIHRLEGKFGTDTKGSTNNSEQ